MNIEEIRDYCLSKTGAEETFPFGDDTLVFKIGGKMFALINLSGTPEINLKCDPAKAISLREEHNFVTPGYHMNKKHWNTVKADRAPSKLICSLIDDSYNLVFEKLPRTEKEKILKK